jgi:serine/threonine-protein kinase
MSLAAGDRLGPYEVLSELGAGGMGEVYRARDATLKRDVALKILPDGFALDQERLARFKREAQVLASLNHSNIAAIYGFEESNGLQALVLELVEGPTLADRIGLGPIPVSEAVPIARQIAEALEAAHEQGIVHRDLKPANVKLRPDGTVKVLDFGLAKSLEPAVGRSGDAAASPTITSPAMTAMGIILGTAAYMSPEQAKGQPADKRSDVWAFGAVLYEMLSGRRAFSGDDVSDTLASVLKGEPDWMALPPDVPAHVRMLIQRCLVKDRRRRMADMSGALFVMTDEVGRLLSLSPGDLSRQLPRWRRLIVPTAAAIAVGALAGTTVWLASRPSPPRVTRLALPQSGAGSLLVDQQSRDLTITPDGTHIVYKGTVGSANASTQLFVRALDALEPTPLAVSTPRAPFASSDGRWIGFVEPAPVTLKKVPITGGAVVPLAPLDGASRGFTWDSVGSIIFATAAPATGLQRISSNGGEVTVLTTPNRERGEGDHLWPQFLPGGQGVLFTITAMAGGIDAARVAVLDLRNPTAAPKVVVTGGSQAQYTASGHLVYAHAGTLRAVPFDVDRLEAIGTSILVVPQVVTLSNGTAEFDIAQNGTLVYVTGGSVVAAPRTLVWVDRQGREEPVKGAPARAFVGPRLSPDGTRVALDIRDREHDIWLWDFARETLDRLTTDPGMDQAPVWTPDGRRVVFSSEAGGSSGSLFWQATDGSGSAERLTPILNVQAPSAVTKDGTLLFSQARPTTSVDIMTLKLEDKDRRREPLLETLATERNADVSPNGRWMAYESNDAGPVEVFVRPFPYVSKQKWRVSSDGGGTQPLWSRDGKELFYLGPGGALMSVTMQPDNWSPGTPTKVIDEPYLHLPFLITVRSYDISLDGKRFLRIKPGSGPEAPTSVMVVQNWFEELKQLVPPPK